MQSPPFTVLSGRLNCLCQSVTSATPQRCPPEEKPAYVDSVGIAAETRGVLVDPSDAAAYLRRHHAEVSARLLHRIEVQDDIMRPSIDEHLRGVAAVLGRA